MSLGSLITKGEAWVEGLFTSFATSLENVWLPAAITITNTLKTIADGDTTDIIGTLVGSAGPTIENTVRATLDKIVPELQLAQSFKTLNDPNAILQAILNEIASASSSTKAAFWIEFSGMVANDFAQGKLTTSEAITLAQYFYSNYPAPQPVA